MCFLDFEEPSGTWHMSLRAIWKCNDFKNLIAHFSINLNVICDAKCLVVNFSHIPLSFCVGHIKI